MKYVFGLWVEAGVPGENPHLHREISTQKGPSWDCRYEGRAQTIVSLHSPTRPNNLGYFPHTKSFLFRQFDRTTKSE